MRQVQPPRDRHQQQGNHAHQHRHGGQGVVEVRLAVDVFGEITHRGRADEQAEQAHGHVVERHQLAADVGRGDAEQGGDLDQTAIYIPEN